MHNLADKQRNNNLSVHHISSHGDYAAVLLKTQTFNQPQHFPLLWIMMMPSFVFLTVYLVNSLGKSDSSSTPPHELVSLLAIRNMSHPYKRPPNRPSSIKRQQSKGWGIISQTCCCQTASYCKAIKELFLHFP